MFRAVRLQTSQLFQPLQGRVNILFGSTAVIAHQTTITMPFRQRLAAQEEGLGGRGGDAGSGGTAFTVQSIAVGLLARARARGVEAHGQSDDKRDVY